MLDLFGVCIVVLCCLLLELVQVVCLCACAFFLRQGKFHTAPPLRLVFVHGCRGKSELNLVTTGTRPVGPGATLWLRGVSHSGCVCVSRLPSPGRVQAAPDIQLRVATFVAAEPDHLIPAQDSGVESERLEGVLRQGLEQIERRIAEAQAEAQALRADAEPRRHAREMEAHAAQSTASVSEAVAR